MKKLLLVCICLAITIIASAQTEDKKWNFGLHGGATQYSGSLGSDFYKGHMAFYGVGGISVSRYLSSHLDLSLLVTKGEVGFNHPEGHFKQDFSSVLLNFRFNLIGPRSPVRPYLLVGGGVMLFDKNLAITDKQVDYIAPSFGGGVNFKFSPFVMLNVQETFLYSTGNKRSGVVGNKNDAYLFHMAGFTFNFGHKKDEDNDGVADRYDKCPATASHAVVDKVGCPIDTDNDGVADYLDTCPNEAGTAALNGCPDKDGDSIADKDDKCPDVAGTIVLKGCPDTDGDGVADADDACPGSKAGYAVDAKGCSLDNDKDGIVNEEDACPDLAGVAALKGCPDADGDGVSDNEDRCPQVKGTMANKGCPEISKEDVKKITQIGSKIFMETNSDNLQSASLAQLDELASILKRYDQANLLIEGYTDSQGDDAANMVLSQKRTEAVKTYLMGRGIMESRLKAVGYGEAKPIADNKTAAGRAKNRRVELTTSY
jgi:outer membrane protein OmpA-like peptidoglycan-associated protein